MEKRNYGPGQHGLSKRRGGKQSEYAIQLGEKQKAKYTYGILERQFSNMFENAQKDVQKNKHDADKSGKSTTSQINFWFKSGEVVSIEIIDWSEKITNEKGWTDNVNVSFRTEEFNDFLGIAFK